MVFIVVVVCVYARACVRVFVRVCVCYSKNVVADHVMLRGTRSRMTMRGPIVQGLWITFCDRMVLNDEWPPMSPDLACIEHLWDILGRAVNKRINQQTRMADLQRLLLQE